ncbi:MAG: endopeptidase La [Desulfobulbaceae bacterium]|nr:endopeptidase La [Desulfobulbaceae bacterium]
MSSEEKIQETPGAKEQIAADPEKLAVPEVLSILPLQGFVFFPGMGFPLQVSHKGSKNLIDDALVKDRLVAMVAHRPMKGKQMDVVPADHLFTIGTMGYIHKIMKDKEGVYQVLVSAVRKIRVLEITQNTPYHVGRVESISMETEESQELEAMVLNLRTQFKKMAELLQLPDELTLTIMSLQNPFHIAYLAGSQLNLSLEEEQKFLEYEKATDLLKKVTLEVTKKLETLEVSQEIQKNIKEDIDKKQREFFLRQQLKAIRKELGEGDENVDLDDLRKKMKKAVLPKEAKATVEKEMGRLARIPSSSPEYTVSRTFIEWILDLPWKISTKDSLNLVKARQILDHDHYGLEKIKKRILEFLAVRTLKADLHGPILCFVGPPGVGKTSLGQSIARTMNKNFVRISLGGVRDEAEIRGHRRTYIGSLPGRIIQSLKKAGSNNPLFMLDEIDKLGNDFRGDPSSALLEVLDPEQNFTFADHYLEIPFDLSKVMFITTANYIENIPGPLRDRMEIIELSSYTEDEKVMIAKRHLINKQLEAHALTAQKVTFRDAAIRAVIRSYTREAGVRNLERNLGGICRGIAMDIVSGKFKSHVVTEKSVHKFLGPIDFYPEAAARNWGPGLATGLAWTPVGGVLLFIEAAKMKGKGSLTLTGTLGDVMKESATAALTYIRSHAKMLKIDDKQFAQEDIHVHVPAGGTPKDGPSAGVAMVVALTSLLSGKSVRKDIAMTGEITLRGDVLPVGGVKEKVLAAVRADIKEVFLPSRNEKDVLDIPASVKKGVSFHFVQEISEVLDKVFVKAD